MKKFFLALFLLIVVCTITYLGVLKFRQSENIKVFHDFEAFKKARMKLPEKHDSVCLVAVGDIMLSRYVAKKINEHNDPNYPFNQVSWFLQSGDITFGNLEAPITPGREIKIHEMLLRADPHVASALKGSGFNVLSLANNHIPDFGTSGIIDTMQYLDENEILYVGAGRNEEEAFAPKYMEVNGMKLAFLAFNDPAIIPDSYKADNNSGTAALEPEKIIASIKRANANADFTIVSLHAGTEYASKPDATQTKFAHLAIDAGADLVLGHHPHVVQKVEIYKGKYIFYSLGNFIFDQFWSEDTRYGVATKIYITKNDVEKIEIMPIYINDDACTISLNGQEAEVVFDKLELEPDITLVPAWDSETETFVKKENYTYYTQKPLPQHRLIQKMQFDLDEDGILEDYSLQNGELIVKRDSHIIWQSPDSWWVDYFFIGDSNNDGIHEINLLVWKEGSFGPYKPIWLTEEDLSVKNHLFIFKLKNQNFKPVWQSSNLDNPNYYANLIDINNDGKNELIVTEGSYTDPKRRKITLWKWNGWGFSLCQGD